MGLCLTITMCVCTQISVNKLSCVLLGALGHNKLKGFVFVLKLCYIGWFMGQHF